MKAQIHVKFAVVGFHCWPHAPAHRAYLRDKHRHTFNVTVTTTVDHDDREIEFHDLIDYARGQFERSFLLEDAIGYNAGLHRSCEHMARELGELLVLRYKRGFEVSVFEDGECGATVKQNGPE